MTKRDDNAPDFGDEDELDDEFEIGSRFDALKARGREVLGGVAERGRERLVEAADRGKGRLADRLSGGADYLRSNDVEIIRSDLVAEIRRHPLRSAVIAVGAGYILGKVLSDATPRIGRRKKGGVASQITRAVVSTVAAMAAARIQASLAEEHREAMEPVAPRPKAPRKRAPKRPT